MKKILFSILAFAALACTLPGAQAQYSLGTATLHTNAIPATTTNTAFSAVIAATRSETIALAASLNLDDAGTTAVVLKFDQSLDNASWKTNAVTLSLTPAGTNTVTAIGNTTMGGIGFLRLREVENPNAAAIENLVVKYAVKRP